MQRIPDSPNIKQLSLQKFLKIRCTQCINSFKTKWFEPESIVPCVIAPYVSDAISKICEKIICFCEEALLVEASKFPFSPLVTVIILFLVIFTIVLSLFPLHANL